MQGPRYPKELREQHRSARWHDRSDPADLAGRRGEAHRVFQTAQRGDGVSAFRDQSAL